ncbi:MAG: FadR family transcriptional regulator [Desulfobacteraceae bacterium]|nr:FadR family transcriptional regulator [Desulfobacteraceae bacterium]
MVLDWIMKEKALKIKKISLVEQVLLRLREDFIHEVFPPGSALPSENELAERLGVSRLTMRSALQRLSSEGWIKVSHGKPTQVLDYRDHIRLDLFPDLLISFPGEIISLEEFSFYHRFLQWLHGAIHLAACRKAKPSDKPGLLEIVSQFSDKLTVREIWDLDFRFYRKLARISENIVLMMLQNTHRDIYRKLLDSGAIIEADYSVSFYTQTARKLTDAICANDEIALRLIHPELVIESDNSGKRLFDNIVKR